MAFRCKSVIPQMLIVKRLKRKRSHVSLYKSLNERCVGKQFRVCAMAGAGSNPRTGKEWSSKPNAVPDDLTLLHDSGSVVIRSSFDPRSSDLLCVEGLMRLGDLVAAFSNVYTGDLEVRVGTGFNLLSRRGPSPISGLI